MRYSFTSPNLAPPARAAGRSYGEIIDDNMITAAIKVKSTLLYSSNVNDSAIEVNTNGGVVTLSGKVGRAERELALELANNVRGVKSVRSKDLTL